MEPEAQDSTVTADPTPATPAGSWKVSWWRTVGQWVVRERWTLLLFAAALAVRLHWNLVVHPLGDYIYSDMRGYDLRSSAIIDDPARTYPYAAFFPYGTHVFVAFLKTVFGRDDYVSISIVYAFLGAGVVAMTYVVGRRASAVPWVPPLAGLILVFYYPLISLGGYMLSEIPFTLCLLGSVALLLRLLDRPSTVTALAAGTVAAIGVIIRPQLLISIALFGLFWLAFRRAMPSLKFKTLAIVAIPLALALGLSSARLHRHTGRFGLVSENGSFNLVFGRCHPTKIRAIPDGKENRTDIHFRPPPFLQLQNHRRKHKDSAFELHQALGDSIEYKGYIGDSRAHMRYIRRCVKKTGWMGQLKYSLTHIALLWKYNISWPDSGKRPWRPPQRWWQEKHNTWFAIPALLALGFIGFPRRTLRQGIVALNLLALLLLAAVFFGGARFRCPYDPLIILLALELYGLALMWAGRKLLWAITALRSRRS